MKVRVMILLFAIIMVKPFAQEKYPLEKAPGDWYYSQLPKSFDVYDKYSKISDGLESTPIKDLPEGENAVRFISEGYSSCYIIKLVWTNNSRKIYFTKGNDDGAKIKIVRKKSIDVSEKDLKEFIALMDERDFYNQPTLRAVSVRGPDMWFVEANIDGKYKAVERWDSDNHFLYAICRKLLRMADEGPSDEELEARHKELEEYRNSTRLLKKK